MKLRTWIVIVLLSLGVGACSSQTPLPADYEPEIFESDEFDITLGFDLRNDDLPTATLVIHAQGTESAELNTITLPFESSQIEKNKFLFSTSGSYYRTTLINYYTMPSTQGSYSINLKPVFPSSPEAYTNPDDTASTLTLYRNGQDRIFIYKYPDSDPAMQSWLQKEGHLNTVKIDAISVAYPKDAEAREIRDTGQTALPTAYPFRNGKARFYPADKQSANGYQALEVKYHLKESQGQIIYQKYALTLFASLLMPLIHLFILFTKGRTHKYFFLFVVLVEALILIGLVVSALIYWGQSSLEVILNLGIAMTSASLSGYVLWKDKKGTP